MQFILIVANGPQQGKGFELQDEVIRVGSGDDMMVRLEIIPDHAMTIIRRDGWYDVINRECAELRVNGRRAKLGQPLKWRRGRVVDINRHVQLVLESADKLAAFSDADDEPEPDDSSARSQRFTKHLTYAAAVAVALYGVTYLLPSRNSSFSEYYGRIADHVAVATHENPEDLELRELVRTLRRARLDDIQLRPASAAYFYRDVKSTLDRRITEQRQQGIQDRSWEQVILDFVNSRIAILG